MLAIVTGGAAAGALDMVSSCRLKSLSVPGFEMFSDPANFTGFSSGASTATSTCERGQPCPSPGTDGMLAVANNRVQGSGSDFCQVRIDMVLV